MSTDHATPRALPDILRTQARRGMSHVVDYRRRLSAAELDLASNRCARALVRAGVGPGDRVALLEHNSVEFLELLFACAKVGAILVPLNSRLAVPELAEVLRSAAPQITIVHQDLFESGVQAARTTGLQASQVWLLSSKEAPDERLYEARCAAEPDAPSPSEKRGDVVCLTYTSGTTGGPKGVMIRHEAFTTFLPAATRAWGLGVDSVNLVVLPMFHIGGISWCIGGLLSGADTVLLRRFDPDEVLDVCEQHRVTHMNVVATILRALLLSQARRARSLAFQTITCGGAPIPEVYLRQAQQVFGGRFVAFYGLSEAGGGVTHNMLKPEYLDSGLTHLLVSAGRPLDGIQVAIRELSGSRTVEAGVDGEIVVLTPGLMAGYWHRPEETAAVVQADGWLRTGDIGQIDGDGFLYIRGRQKEIIISGGENIYPGEIEDVIAAIPGVVEVSVVGVPHEVWGETPVAVLATLPGSAVSEDGVIACCRAQLARFKCPAAVHIVDELPHMSNGKLDRKALRETIIARSR